MVVENEPLRESSGNGQGVGYVASLGRGWVTSRNVQRTVSAAFGTFLHKASLFPSVFFVTLDNPPPPSRNEGWNTLEAPRTMSL